MKKAQMPTAIKPYQEDYKDGAWQQYSEEDYCDWVRLLMTRARHRTNLAKKQKDLIDAYNYLVMFIAKVEAERQTADEGKKAIPIADSNAEDVGKTY